MSDREANFERAIVESDERALSKCVDFEEHRFVSIERDVVTMNRYAQGHKSLRGASSHMARAVESGEAYVPEFVLDLDTGEMHEIDLFVHVAPKSVNAVAVMMPRSLLDLIDEGLRSCDDPELKERLEPAFKLLERAKERRR